MIWFIIGIAIVAILVIYGRIRFKHQTRELPNVVYRIQEMFYPAASRRSLILKGINAKLKEIGIPRLKSDAFISQLATRRCNEIDETNNPNHTLVSNEFAEMRKKGLDTMAECLTYELFSAESVIFALMHSKEHRVKIMNPIYDVCGIGCKKDERGKWIDIVLLGDEKSINKFKILKCYE